MIDFVRKRKEIDSYGWIAERGISWGWALKKGQRGNTGETAKIKDHLRSAMGT